MPRNGAARVVALVVVRAAAPMVVRVSPLSLIAGKSPLAVGNRFPLVAGKDNEALKAADKAVAVGGFQQAVDKAVVNKPDSNTAAGTLQVALLEVRAVFYQDALGLGAVLLAPVQHHVRRFDTHRFAMKTALRQQ